MNFRKLLEIITEMSEEEKDQVVTVHAEGSYYPMSLLTTVTFSDDEDNWPIGTIILS